MKTEALGRRFRSGRRSMRYTRRRKTSWKIRRSFAILGISGLATGMTVNVRNMLHELVGYESLI